MPHVIRLRDPWLRETPADGAAQAPFVRKFNWPRAAARSASERVELVVEGARAGGQVMLNGSPLGEIRPPIVRFDVSHLLTPHNELMIGFSAPAEEIESAAIGDVRLEIFDDDVE